jgi:hypothetical protein
VTNLWSRDWRPLRTPEPLANRFDGAAFYWKFSTRYKDIDEDMAVAISTSMSNFSGIGTAPCQSCGGSRHWSGDEIQPEPDVYTVKAAGTVLSEKCPVE